jgi:hypothetical protein
VPPVERRLVVGHDDAGQIGQCVEDRTTEVVRDEAGPEEVGERVEHVLGVRRSLRARSRLDTTDERVSIAGQGGDVRRGEGAGRGSAELAVAERSTRRPVAHGIVAVGRRGVVPLCCVACGSPAVDPRRGLGPRLPRPGAGHVPGDPGDRRRGEEVPLVVVLAVRGRVPQGELADRHPRGGAGGIRRGGRGTGGVVQGRRGRRLRTQQVRHTDPGGDQGSGRHDGGCGHERCPVPPQGSDAPGVHRCGAAGRLESLAGALQGGVDQFGWGPVGRGPDRAQEGEFVRHGLLRSGGR